MVVATSNDKRAFVANIGSGSVTVIDLEKGVAVQSIATSAGAEGIALSPDGNELWVTNRAANSVSIIDTKKLKVVDTLHSESFPIRIKFTPDGPALRDPRLDVSRRDKYALVSNAQSGIVRVFDVKKRKEAHTISFDMKAAKEQEQRLFGDRFGSSPVPIGIVIPLDGEFAYVANSNADVIAVVDLSDWKVMGWIKTGREPDGLGWSQVRVQGSGYK